MSTSAKTHSTACPVCHKAWKGPAGVYRCTCGAEYKLYAGQTAGQIGSAIVQTGRAITGIFWCLVLLGIIFLIVHAATQ